MALSKTCSGAASEQLRRTVWLSRDLTALVEERPCIADPCHVGHYDFDIVIVGSGYGASVVAAELSGSEDEYGKSVSVCILERGKEYLAGSFPSRQADLVGHIRFATAGASRQSGVHEGLYDLRLSDDAIIVAASGLGGGSLINAGVMEMPVKEVFQEARWPTAIRNEVGSLDGLADELRRRLGAKRLPVAIRGTLSKTTQLEKLAGSGEASRAHITVAAKGGPNSAGVDLSACLMCGDCATGCNHNSKDSLDLNLLVSAQCSGAVIVTRATVLRVASHPLGIPGWAVEVNHTDAHLRDRQPAAFQFRTKRVVLAAGTLGSTEILMRSKGSLNFSQQLGQKFSANGDMLVTAYNLAETANAVADECVPPEPPTPGEAGRRRIGPTITSMIDLRTGDPKYDLVIQDLAVPGALRRVFEESTTTFDVLNQLGAGDFAWHRSDEAPDDAAINPRAINNSLILAMIGRDDASGELSLGKYPLSDNADGLLTVRWPELRMDRRFDDHHWRLAEMMKSAKVGGWLVNNPVWRPFTENIERLFGRQRGPLITVHPLGGCAMGNSVRHGVTDHCGRVFDAGATDDRSVHQGLVVLDGSIVPTSLGINPALTIAVLALRAITLLKEEWQLKKPPSSSVKKPAIKRPIFATPTVLSSPKPTKIELTEQVRGHVKLRNKLGRRIRCAVQLTITTQPANVADLIAHQASQLRGFKIPADRCNLTILRSGKEFDRVSDLASPNDVALEAMVSGQLRLFAHEPSDPYLRSARALWAWIVNRGLRDAGQKGPQLLVELINRPPKTHQPKVRLPWYQQLWIFFVATIRVCSRAGGIRLIEYDMKIEKILRVAELEGAAFEQKSFRAVKRLTYGRATSPFTQLLGMSLESFPQMSRVGKPPQFDSEQAISRTAANSSSTYRQSTGRHHGTR